MVQHPDRECVIKDSRERQVVDISLDDMCVRQFAGRGERSLNRVAKIDADDISGAKPRGQLRMSPLPTTAFEHDFVFEEFSGDRSNPGEKLVLVACLGLLEVLPLPTEFLGSGGFVLCYFINRRKARHPTHNGPGVITRLTVERAFDDFRLLARDYRANANGPGARRTNEVLN